MAKYCKIRKIYVCEICKYCIFLYYARKSLTTSGEFRLMWEGVSALNTNMHKICKCIFSVFYNISQPKLGNFTNLKMLFPTIVKGFVLFAKIKIQLKRGMVHLAKISNNTSVRSRMKMSFTTFGIHAEGFMLTNLHQSLMMSSETERV